VVAGWQQLRVVLQQLQQLLLLQAQAAGHVLQALLELLRAPTQQGRLLQDELHDTTHAAAAAAAQVSTQMSAHGELLGAHTAGTTQQRQAA
jgi:hypothetical protein